VKKNSRNKKIENIANLTDQALKDQSHFARVSFLIKDSALYGIASAISRALALISFPILARYFSLSEFGAIDFFMVLSGLLTTFLIFGQDSAVARYFYEYDEYEERRQIISQSLIFQFFGIFISIPIFFLFAEIFTDALIQESNRVRFFEIILFQLPFLLLINFSQNLLKWTFSRVKFLIMSVGLVVVQTVSLVIAITFLKEDVEGILVTYFFCNAIFGLLGLFYVRKWLTIPADFKYLRELLMFAVPFGLICILNALVPVLERSLTSNYLGAKELGLYATAVKIAMIISLFVGAFQTAWGPFSLSIYKHVNAGQTYNLVFKLFTYISCLAALIITLIAMPLIQFLATDKYIDSVVVVFPLVMGLTIQSIGWISEIGINISKRPFLNVYSYALAAVSSVIGILFLAPIFGLVGVGLGVLFGHILKTLISSLLAQRAYPLPWQYKPVFIVIALTLLGGGLSIWASLTHGITLSNFVLGAFLIIELIIGWAILFQQNERVQLISIMKNYLHSKLP
jgi:O-antigen/teichoic acid export membrane protein